MGAHGLRAALAVIVVLAHAGCGGDPVSQEPTAPHESGVVARVNDGDTLTLASGARVRLVQIDAPELTRECFGRAARRALAALVPVGARVRLVRDPALDDRDAYGRMLRYVGVGETDVNLELVRRGAASPYFFRGERGRRAGELLDAAEEARAARRGYWGACPGARLETGLGSVTGPA